MANYPMLPAAWVDFIDEISPNQRRSGPPAPHQPALLLTWLAHNLGTGQTALPFSIAEQTLRCALPELSPSKGIEGKTYMPMHAFANKGEWTLTDSRGAALSAPGVTEMRDAEAQLTPNGELAEAWRTASPNVHLALTETVLRRFFPYRTWQHVIDQIPGLRISASSFAPTNEPAATEDLWGIREVLIREQQQCQACARTTETGLLALAFAWWPTHGGPIEEHNALLLCHTHAYAFDLGLLGVRDGTWVDSNTFDLHKQEAPVRNANLDWHTNFILRAA